MDKKAKIAELIEDAETYELENRAILKAYSPEELARLYNGIGPESFPAWLRGMVTALHPTLEPVALIHDVEWSDSDGTLASFHASNDRFERNGRRIAEGRYGWYHPLRWVVMRQASRFARLCDWFGWAAWRKA